MEYKKTKWVDNKTPVDAARLNKIEDAIETLAKTTITAGKLKTVNGKSLIGSGNLSIDDLEGMSGGAIADSLGYIPAKESDLPVWEDIESDGSYTVTAPETKVGEGISCPNGELAVGTWNLSVPGNTFEIGSGSGPENRRNSLEIKETGEVYIYGVGGYDGTNSGDSGVSSVSESLSTGSGSGAVWVGTRKEYEALTEISENKLYYIKKS